MKWYYYLAGAMVLALAGWVYFADRKKVHASAAKARAAKEEKRLINLNITDDVTIRKSTEEIITESGQQSA
jgi:hypothetical protein